MAGASYYHWCSSLHLVSAACQFSCSCFHMWAMFLLVEFFFFRLLDTLFFQPELDIVLPAYVQGCNDWLWQKGYLPPSSKKEWWPLRQLSFAISHASLSSCNFISYCFLLCPWCLFLLFFFFTGNVKLIFHKPTAVSVNEIITYSFGLNCDLIALITSLSHTWLR